MKSLSPTLRRAAAPLRHGDAERHAGPRADPALRGGVHGALRRLHLPGSDARLPARPSTPSSGAATDFDWDAVVPNMVYVWTGLTQAIGLRYYGVPGIDVGPDVGFQYREPAEDDAFMKREEYDELIDDPVALPLRDLAAARLHARSAPRASRRRTATTSRSSRAGWRCCSYFTAFGPQIERMRHECGTVSAICGMLKAPLDILADKLRGYIGLAFDLMEIPGEGAGRLRGADAAPRLPRAHRRGPAAADPHPHLDAPRLRAVHLAATTSRPSTGPRCKPIVEALWAQGNQMLFYAEGKWDAHLERFAELPAGSIVYHVDRDDPAMRAPHPGREVLPERRRAQHAAGLRHARTR